MYTTFGTYYSFQMTVVLVALFLTTLLITNTAITIITATTTTITNKLVVLQTTVRCFIIDQC